MIAGLFVRFEKQRETQATHETNPAKQTCIACRTFRLALPYSVRAEMFGQVLQQESRGNDDDADADDGAQDGEHCSSMK
jgi:hypothetical protein